MILSICLSLFISIYLSIYTPGQKYKTTLKNEEKDIVYCFLIMKIRYMKDKTKTQLNLKYEEFQFLFYMYISNNA